MAEMSDFELLALISEAESDSVQFNGTFMRDNVRLLRRYLGEPYGDEVEGRSQVISTDVADVVEADMPSLARVFLGPGNIVTFNANTDNEDEIQEAEDKTKYVNWLVRNQPESFATIHGWMKDAEIQKMGVVKYFIDDSRTTSEEKFTGVDSLELQQIMESLRGEDVTKVEIIGQSENVTDEEADSNFDITFRVTKGKQKVRIVNVRTEDFLISSGADSIDDAEMVGDRMLKTRGELVAEGFDEKIIRQLPSFSSGSSNTQSGGSTSVGSNMKQVRNADQGGDVNTTINDWASEDVEIIDMSIKVDYDQDGIAERRHIIKSGQHILVNEQFDHVPYALLSAILMPHKAIGRSRAEITEQTMRVKTVILRQTLDNLYFVNNARNVVSENVNLDDMLTVRPNGIVRTTGDVQAAVFPLVTEYIGDKSLQIIQYMDFQRAQTTGTLMASQGLDADALNSETATRFQGLQDEGSAKIELVARVYAETGFRKLFEGVAWLVSKFQDTETEFMVLGKALKVDPSKWKFDHHVVADVGTGAGDNDKLVGSIQGILQIQQQLKLSGSQLVDEKKIFNSLERLTKGIGLPRVDEFFNDPEKPDELLQAQNEQLTQAVQALQQQVEQLQNPLAEAETIRATEKAQSSQSKNQLELVKAQDKREQFNISERNEMIRHDDDIAVQLTKLELDSGFDVPGSTV